MQIILHSNIQEPDILHLHRLKHKHQMDVICMRDFWHNQLNQQLRCTFLARYYIIARLDLFLLEKYSCCCQCAVKFSPTYSSAHTCVDESCCMLHGNIYLCTAATMQLCVHHMLLRSPSSLSRTTPVSVYCEACAYSH